MNMYSIYNTFPMVIVLTWRCKDIRQSQIPEWHSSSSGFWLLYLEWYPKNLQPYCVKPLVGNWLVLHKTTQKQPCKKAFHPPLYRFMAPYCLPWIAVGGRECSWLYMDCKAPVQYVRAPKQGDHSLVAATGLVFAWKVGDCFYIVLFFFLICKCWAVIKES